MNERNAIIYATVCRIPCGCVAAYGQVARLSGLGRMARQVGYALNSLPEDSEVPWHRVVNAKGEISARSPTGRESESIQRLRLEAEGVRFDANGRLRLADHAWALVCE